MQIVPFQMDFNSLPVILAVAVALGCDTFAVGLAIGTTSPSPRAAFRLWFHFGVFQGLMPITGWVFGQTVLPLIRDFDHLVAAGLMAIIAARMLAEGISRAPIEAESTFRSKDPTRGWSLMALSFATSFDALGVGFGMGVTNSRPYFPSIIIGLMASLMTYIGISLGRRLSLQFGRRTAVLGALVLFGVAFKLLEI